MWFTRLGLGRDHTDAQVMKRKVMSYYWKIFCQGSNVIQLSREK